MHDSSSKFRNGGANLGWRFQGKVGTNSKNNIGTRGVKGSLQTKRLTNNPLYPVAFNCPFQLSMNTDSNSIVSQFIGTENQTEPFTVSPCSPLINPVKLPALT